MFPGVRRGHVPPHPRAIRAAAEVGPRRWGSAVTSLRNRAGTRSPSVSCAVPAVAPRHSSPTRQRDGRSIDLAALEVDLLADDEDETTLIVGQWRFVGVGWGNEGEVELARAAAARAEDAPSTVPSRGA